MSTTVSDDVSLLREALAEIERLNQCLQYEQHCAGRMGTHGPGCHTWGPEHYECAMAVLQRRTELLREARTDVYAAQMRLAMAGYSHPMDAQWQQKTILLARIDEELKAPPSNDRIQAAP